MQPKTNRHKSYDESFAELFGHLSAGLLLYARRFVSIHQVAEDIVHDVFVDFWVKKEKINYDTAKYYLFRSVHNDCLDYLKGLKVKTKAQQEILINQDLPDSLDITYYIYSELKSHIDDAVEKLPPQQKEAFVKSRFEKKSNSEIAAQMNISPRTVEKHIELSLKRLRRELAEYLYIMACFGLFLI